MTASDLAPRPPQAPPRPVAGKPARGHGLDLRHPAGWAAIWALGFAALAALGLIVTDSWTVFLGLLLVAVPGLVSKIWRPGGGARIAVLAGWALVLTGAALQFGGAAGPLLLVTLGPALAGVVLGDGRPGVVLAALALLGTWLATALGWAADPALGGFGMFLSVAATALVGASAVQAVLVARRAQRLVARPAARPPSIAPAGAPVPAAAASPAPELQHLPAHEPDLTPHLEAARQAALSAEAERDAARAESAAKSRFLANMSHELRTPLNAIIGFSDIMRNKLFGPLPERYGEYAEMIHESGQHLTDLINDILDMSKLEADRYVLHREVFDAREPIASALKLMRLQADDKGVHLRGDLPSEPLTVDADRRACKQIVLNLLSNALKFTPPGGRIHVALRSLPALDGGASALELVVADTGMGISPEDLARLGTPYEQTDAGRQAQGTGLGLSLVKALTALHGGEFSLESRLGEGSAATVRLPVLAPEAAALAISE